MRCALWLLLFISSIAYADQSEVIADVAQQMEISTQSGEIKNTHHHSESSLASEHSGTGGAGQTQTAEHAGNVHGTDILNTVIVDVSQAIVSSSQPAAVNSTTQSAAVVTPSGQTLASNTHQSMLLDTALIVASQVIVNAVEDIAVAVEEHSTIANNTQHVAPSSEQIGAASGSQPPVLNTDEAKKIVSSPTIYGYFGTDMCPVIADLPMIQKFCTENGIACPNITALCEYIEQKESSAPIGLIELAVEEAIKYSQQMPSIQKGRFTHFLRKYLRRLKAGEASVIVKSNEKDEEGESRSACREFCTLKVGSLTALCAAIKNNLAVGGDLSVDGSENIGNNLTVGGNTLLAGDTIINNLTVVGTANIPGTIVTGCQPGPISIGTSDATSLTFATDGCSNSRLVINQGGAVTIEAPTTGNTALTIDGNGTDPTLQLNNNQTSTGTDVILTINPTTGAVDQSTITLANVITNGCQTGPLSIGTSNATSLTLATNGCGNSRLVIDPNGATSVAAPTTGTALTVTGDSTDPALKLINNPASAPTDFLLTINATTNAVDESTVTIGSVVTSGCQPGPLSIGTSDATSLTLATNGCGNSRLVIDPNGATSVAAPTTGTALTVTGDSTDPALKLINNPASAPTDLILTINPTTNAVDQSTVTIGSIVTNNCQPGPLTIGTSDATNFNLAAGTCTPRVTISGTTGGVTIANPTSGVALTIVGGGETITAGNLNVVAGNILLPEANAGGTQGLLILGAAPGMQLYTVGNGNLFAVRTGTAVSAVTGTNNIVIGQSAGASIGAANNAIVIGTSANDPGGSGGIAIGDAAVTGGQANAVSLGTSAQALTATAISIGSSASAQGSAANFPAIAIGANSNASGGENPLAIGTGSQANARGSIAIGGDSAQSSGFAGPTANAIDGIAIGSAGAGGAAPVVSATNGIAIGSGGPGGAGPIASGVGAVAIGGTGVAAGQPGPIAQAIFGFAVGPLATAGQSGTDADAIALGRLAESGNLGIAIGGASGIGGTGTQATGQGGIAIGTSATTSGTNSGPLATGFDSIAIGSSTASTVGVNCQATGNFSIAIGNNAHATGIDAIAIGGSDGTPVGAIAAAGETIAMGAGSSATGTNSVAIGFQAATAQNNAIVLGNTGSAAVAVGIGTSTPGAKIHAVSASALPVAILDAGAGATIASAPQFLNLTTTTGTTLVLNGNSLALLGSSQRFKENFRSIDSIAKKIYELLPVIFDYRKENGGARNQLGFTAEQVASIFPDLVNYEADGITPLSIRYECLHALAIRAIQEHKKQLDEQTETISKLLAVVSMLEQKVAALEAR